MEERLQKIIARAGIASRRAAEKLIEQGLVTVNGKTVTQLGSKANPAADHIKVRGKLINPLLEQVKTVYVLLNKPKGFLSSVSDPENRKLVTDLVPDKYGRLFPVGRLDFNSEGLIILTNDGKVSNRIASSKSIPKVYEVKVKGRPPEKAIEKLRRGLVLDDGYKTAPAGIRLLRSTDSNSWYEVTLKEGHNQQIRRMFDSISFSVTKLRRIAIGHLRIGGIPAGGHRMLQPEEINAFK